MFLLSESLTKLQQKACVDYYYVSFAALGKLAEQFIVEGVTSKIYVTKPQQQKPFTLKVGKCYQRLEPDKSVRCF